MRGRGLIPPPPGDRAAVLVWTGIAYRWVSALASGLVLTSSSRTPSWTAPTAADDDPRNVDQGSHFLAPTVNSNVITNYGDLLVYTSGGGASLANQPSTETARPGQIRLTTGTSAAGQIAIYTSRDGIRLGGGPWTVSCGVRPVTLSTAGERYALEIGLMETVGTVNQTDGAYFLYDEGGVATGAAASANWQCVTVKSSARTYTTTSVAVSTSTWADLQIRVDAAASSVDFLIGGAVVATHTTTIPTASSEQVCFAANMVKSAGTTARQCDLDYYRVRGVLV